jgi:2-iminobutanoate/2-iminopropanoate deaminase
VSGQLPFDGDGRRVEGSLGDQSGACFDRVADVLATEGATLADVVRITAYLVSLDDYNDYSRVRGERFSGNLPASTAVGVAGLIGGAGVEIDAIAFIADR